jgi:hypothetical protein
MATPIDGMNNWTHTDPANPPLASRVYDTNAVAQPPSRITTRTTYAT